jgi:hypothetical protein
MKHIYDIIPMPEEMKPFVIKAACIAVGIAAIYVLTIVFVLLFDFVTSVSKKPLSYLLETGEDALSRKTIRGYHIIGFGMLVLMTLVMLEFSSAQSFWGDELEWSLGRVMNKNFEEITRQLLQDGYNMPLHYYALAIIYPLVPFGEGYLSSLSIAFVVIGIVFLYLAAKEIGGERLGFITLCVASLSGTLMSQGGWEVRPYAFYFCFSALTVWFYFKRTKRESWKNIMAFAFAMILLIYSHWFGAIMLIFYGISDIFLCVRRKIKIRCITSYLIAGGAAMPWFLMMVLAVKSNLSTYWAVVPGWLSPASSIKYLLGGDALSPYLFAVAVIIGFIILLQSIHSKEWTTTLFLWVQTLSSTAWMIGVTFVYSKFVNPNGSVYVARYFFAIIPHALLILAFGIKSIGELLKGSEWTSNKIKIAAYFAVFLVIVGVANYSSAIIQVMSPYQAFRESAEYLAADESAYADDTLVVTASSGSAWIEYYFVKHGFAIPYNVATGRTADLILIVKDSERISSLFTLDDLLTYEKVYYAYQDRNKAKEGAVVDFLNENYEMIWENEKAQLMYYEKLQHTEPAPQYSLKSYNF